MKNLSKVLAVSACALGFGTAAMAADVGGTCCADLEERVAELEATAATKGNRRVSLQVYGQINAAIIWHDRPEWFDKQAKIIDNSLSQSRFGFVGKGKVGKSWETGYRIEVGLNPADSTLSIRHAYVWIKSKELGAFALGQQSTATDGIMEISLSNANTASMQGSLSPFDTFVENQTGLGVVNPFDGGRKQVAKYISPTVAGFSVSAAWADDDTYDVALKFANEAGGLRLAFGAGYREDTIRQFYGGSASLMHVKSGLFIDGAYAVSDGIQQFRFSGMVMPIGDFKVTLMGGRAGIEVKTFPMGKTTIFGEYARIEIDGASFAPNYYGLGIVQGVNDTAAQIYLSWRRYDADLGTDTATNVVVGGVLVKF